MNINLSKLIEDGVTIVTPTKRLSRHITYQFAKEKIKKKTSWITPDCLPWDAWCKGLFDQLLFSIDQPQILLNSFQQQWLWEKIINDSIKNIDEQLPISSISKEAIYCYKLCKAWNIPIFPEGIDITEAAEIFKDWVDIYEKKKNVSYWLDDACLPDYVASHFKEIFFDSEKIIFYGFDRLTDQQLSLKKLLDDSKMYVDLPESEDRHKKIEESKQDDEDSEILAAACWAKEKLKENNDISIGIISKNIDVKREKLEYGFSSILTPEKFSKPQSQFYKPYSISKGRPLSTYPLVNLAINLLSLSSEDIPMVNFLALLNSRFIRGVTAEAGAKFDMRLRRVGETKLALGKVVTILDTINDKECQNFIKLLKNFKRSFQSTFKKKMKISEWITEFTHWLTIFGWPNEESLNSEEYQVLQKWKDILNSLGSLSEYGESVNFETAFSQFKEMLVDTSFQIETPYETPIQILGTTGAAGAQFDYLWIMGARDDMWPRSVSNFGFLPSSCKAKIPGNTPESRMQETEDITAALVRSTESAVFSYIKDEDGHARLSPFIEEKHKPSKYKKDHEEDDYRKINFGKTSEEKIIDIKAPAIDKNHQFVAGSSLLKDQFNCPFKAFANHRLYARPLEEPDDGLNAAERGTLAHEVMRYFWKEVKKWENLESQAKDGAKLDKSINAAVSKAIKDMATDKPKTFSTTFKELEQERLQNLLKDWLKKELERSTFEVLEIEKNHEVTFGGIKFRLRRDRIDRVVDNGSYWIIDYKTGSVGSLNDWFENTDLHPNHRLRPRIKEPQMPLYAVTSEYPLSGLFYACLKTGELDFVGTEVNKTYLFNLGQALEVATTEFRQGHAVVDPVDCTYCNLDGLCRIQNKKERPRRK